MPSPDTSQTRHSPSCKRDRGPAVGLLFWTSQDGPIRVQWTEAGIPRTSILGKRWEYDTPPDWVDAVARVCLAVGHDCDVTSAEWRGSETVAEMRERVEGTCQACGSFVGWRLLSNAGECNACLANAAVAKVRARNAEACGCGHSRDAHGSMGNGSCYACRCWSFKQEAA